MVVSVGVTLLVSDGTRDSMVEGVVFPGSLLEWLRDLLEACDVVSISWSGLSVPTFFLAGDASAARWASESAGPVGRFHI